MINQPVKPLIDLIKKLGLDLGVIENLYGNVFDVPAEEESAAGAQWFFVQGLGSIPRDVLVDAAINDRSYDSARSIAGITNLAQANIRKQSKSLLLYTGVTPQDGEGTITVPIEIKATGADIGLYVNDVSVLKSTDVLNTSIILGPQKNVIQIVLERFDPALVTIKVPANLPIGQEPNPPKTPVWGTPPAIFGFFGTTELSASLQLRWADSSFAGAWKIERTSYRLLSTINTVSYDSGAEEYTINVDGTHGDVSPNLDVLVENNTLLGSIVSVTENVSDTDFVISSTVAQGSWVGANFWIADAQGIIATIEREDALIPGGAGIFIYNDTAVKESLPYSYRLSASHPLHPNLESGWTAKETIFALDTFPPGSPTIQAVSVTGTEVTVDYTPPSDPDYLGVRVFLADFGGPGIYLPIMNDFGRPGEPDQLSFFAPLDGDYWLRSFDGYRNIQPEGQGATFNVVLGADGVGIDPTPDITFRVLPTGAWDPALRTDVEIAAVVEGPRTISTLEYFIGNLPASPTWITAPSNPYTISFTRNSTDLSPRILNVKATASDSTVSYDVFVVDWDRLPGISTYSLQPRYQSQVQIGWNIIGTTDDDANSVGIQILSGQGSIDSPTIVDTDNIKDFVFTILQTPGSKAEVHITPYESTGATGKAGRVLKLLPFRNPISYYLLRDINLTQVEITLVSIP